MNITKESIQQPFWAMSADETLKVLQTSSNGLDEKEALFRLRVFGANSIEEKRQFTKTRIILNQFKNPLILILVAAGTLTLFLQKWTDAGVIFAAIFLNTALGFYQENKAETALALLKTYVRVRARVTRNKNEHEIDAEGLVPGDVITISQGDRIPADARVIHANNFEVDEAVLTGESVAEIKNTTGVHANTVLADRTSMIYGGTLAVRGFAKAVVTATDAYTEFGKIASYVASSERRVTPLQKTINEFSLYLSLGAGLAVTVLFFAGLLVGYGIFEMFITSVAVLVAVVPEGLPIALTVILAVGVVRLAKKKGIVRRLLAAETLGATSCILTDKTGTLTQAKMELVSVHLFGNGMEEKKIFEEALSTFDIVVENREAKFSEWKIIGSPLESALVKGAAAKGSFYPDILKRANVVDRLPFNSEYKFAAAIVHEGSKKYLNVLGAPDVLIRFSNLAADEKESIAKMITALASKGQRVVGAASRKLGADERVILSDRSFSSLIFHGLLAFHDPLRPHVKESMKKITASGVKTIIVTGDHHGTAEAVARELGMLDGGGAVLTADDLRYLSAEELAHRADTTSVYARVMPEDKLKLVRLYQKKGEVVAVTGDGVNDAPALKEADIGVALGSGTDVAKGAADLVLLDDNFETLVLAIEEGRRIMQNIRKVIVYLFSTVYDELILIGGAMLFGLPLPINALQILFVNFFADSFPALAFAFESGVDDHLHKTMRSGKKLFDREIKIFIFIVGLFTSSILFVLYWLLLSLQFDASVVRSFIFASFATYTLVASFALRSLKKSIFEYNPFSNKYLTGGVCVGLCLMAFALYHPVFQEVLKTTALPPVWLVGVLGVGALNIGTIEFGKLLFRKNFL